MEKRISYDQFQSVKRVAQACNPLIVKRDTGCIIGGRHQVGDWLPCGRACKEGD